MERIVSSSNMACPKTEEEWKAYKEKLQKVKELRKQGICISYS